MPERQYRIDAVDQRKNADGWTNFFSGIPTFQNLRFYYLRIPEAVIG